MMLNEIKWPDPLRFGCCIDQNEFGTDDYRHGFASSWIPKPAPSISVGFFDINMHRTTVNETYTYLPALDEATLPLAYLGYGKIDFF